MAFKIDTNYILLNVEYEKIKLKSIRITAFNNISNQTDETPNIMASNRLVYEGAVAISRDIKNSYKLKFGDLIYIKKLHKYFVIEDLMNKKYKNSVDVFMFSKEEALKFGVKKSDIVIYKIKRD